MARERQSRRCAMATGPSESVAPLPTRNARAAPTGGPLRGWGDVAAARPTVVVVRRCNCRLLPGQRRRANRGAPALILELVAVAAAAIAVLVVRRSCAALLLFLR
jgi:hypothetical protein